MADADPPPVVDANSSRPRGALNLKSFPLIYVLDSHLTSQQLGDAEDLLHALKAPMTFDIREARLVLANVSTQKRAKLELRWLGINIVDDEQDQKPPRKRTKVEHDAPSSDSETVDSDGYESQGMASPSISQVIINTSTEPQRNALAYDVTEFSFSSNGMVVAKLDWLYDCVSSDALLPLSSYTLLRGQPEPVDQGSTSNTAGETSNRRTKIQQQQAANPKNDVQQTVLERAALDNQRQKNRFSKRSRVKEAADRDFGGRSFSSSTQLSRMHQRRSGQSQPAHLLHQTTSEHEDETEAVADALPPLPDWVLNNQTYSCQRVTPADQPNELFISQLNRIKLARVLTLDEIGVRAYSTCIAALAAYPYRLQSPQEIVRLPGCDQKIAQLFHEFRANDGQIQAVVDLEADPILKVLTEFYEIWGVGAVTARDFYYDKGWKDLDDIIEFGWKLLNRVQQIGLKYYDEFHLKIPRGEVESIADTITEHAKRVTDNGIQTIVVGGYRRGKLESGDVDVILSHPSQEVTLDLVSQVVKSLEIEGWITHTLTLNLTNSKRNQETLPVRPSTLRGAGFDTLDKALVVWQDPYWSTKEADLVADSKAKNPNPHRRVDIIISPWRTVGCAVAGWTSGTTFQRDLRRFVKKEKGWKFDSSGVRDRATGNWIDLERWRNEETRCKDWKEAERRVFEGLGLVYREPWERCTW